MRGHYEVLGVSPAASVDEIKKAYREQVKIWHPDLFRHDAKLYKKAEKKLQELNRAYDALTETAGKSPSPPAAASTLIKETTPSRSKGGVWPILAVLAAFAVLLIFLSSQGGSSGRVADSGMFSSEPVASSGPGMNRYSLNSASGKGFYIIEGPRVPLDWEIDALVHAYTSRLPRAKQSVGNFTISQTQKPDDRDLIPLR